MIAVLLHGLARSDASMAGMGRALADAGWEIVPIDYPSRSGSIAELTRYVIDEIVRQHPGGELDAVTHSLGGIIFRHLHHPLLRWRRAVMIAPPNRGSQTAAAYVERPAFGWFYGPAGRELANSAAAWPAPPCPFAVIAGTKRRALVNPTSWVSGRVFGDDQQHDGTVAVDETRLDGMAGFREVDATHTTIMDQREVQELAIAFLRDGRMPGG